MKLGYRAWLQEPALPASYGLDPGAGVGADDEKEYLARWRMLGRTWIFLIYRLKQIEEALLLIMRKSVTENAGAAFPGTSIALG